MTAGSEMLADRLAYHRHRAEKLLGRWRPELVETFELVQWGYVLEEPAIGRSSSERLGGINAGLVASGDVILEEPWNPAETPPETAVWGHWRPKR
jgi:hypothetical protein